MHETRFINEIFTVLDQELKQRKPVGQVVANVRLSPFSHVSAGNLQDSFLELTKEKGLDYVQLKIFPLEALLECKKCQKTSRITKREFSCPFCNSADINIRMDKEFYVESIEVEIEDKENNLD